VSRVERALARARGALTGPPPAAEPTPETAAARAASGSTAVSRTLAVGDPQAPLATFLQILDLHGALGADGLLAPEVELITMGDYFDWGAPAERAAAADDALALLTWLALHPREQVSILAGNHDLARVGELHGVGDEDFAAAQTLADAAYFAADEAAARRFSVEHPRYPSAELVARDLSTYRSSQGALVQRLLNERRLRLAAARDDLLFVHAGITELELSALGIPRTIDAAIIARALNDALDDAVSRWRTSGAATPLTIPGIHRPGGGTREGAGALYHRVSLGLDVEERRLLEEPPPRRRFSPSAIPRGLVQVIGHVRDEKCRKLLGPVCDHQPAADGPLWGLFFS
jgi:hypothetical protein